MIAVDLFKRRERARLLNYLHILKSNIMMPNFTQLFS